MHRTLGKKGYLGKQTISDGILQSGDLGIVKRRHRVEGFHYTTDAPFVDLSAGVFDDKISKNDDPRHAVHVRQSRKSFKIDGVKRADKQPKIISDPFFKVIDFATEFALFQNDLTAFSDGKF